eukprot:3735665-Karenia_brevis.AAC.1
MPGASRSDSPCTTNAMRHYGSMTCVHIPSASVAPICLPDVSPARTVYCVLCVSRCAWSDDRTMA